LLAQARLHGREPSRQLADLVPAAVVWKLDLRALGRDPAGCIPKSTQPSDEGRRERNPEYEGGDKPRGRGHEERAPDDFRRRAGLLERTPERKYDPPVVDSHRLGDPRLAAWGSAAG